MRLVNRFKNHCETVFLLGALIALLIAISQPHTTTIQDRKSTLFIVDVTQSMNVQDMTLSNTPVSRLEYSKYLLKNAVKSLPCGSQVGLGVFFKTTATLLYTPIETCANYHVLLNTINHLDWRMASQGNSNLRIGVLSMQSLLTTNGDHIGQVIFMTDGQEAPPLNIFTKVPMAKWLAEQRLLVVGLGSDKPSPIPKLSDKNAVIGYWSTDAIKLNPASNVDEGHNGGRDNSIATEPYEYYLSKLDENYLKELTKAIGVQYLKAGSLEAFIAAINEQSSGIQLKVKFALNWLFALIALILLIAIYIPDMLFRINQKFFKQQRIYRDRQ